MKGSQLFDRSKIQYYPLSERTNRVCIEECQVDYKLETKTISEKLQQKISLAANEILKARKKGSSVICAFGAHAIKNGLGSVLGEFARRGWFTHLATNGAGIIHDWEFAYQGMTSEDVMENVRDGKFGIWNETGYYLNLALAVGAFEGLGYGESIGSLIVHNGLRIPKKDELLEIISQTAKYYMDQNVTHSKSEALQKCSAAADLLELITALNISEGFLSVNHPYQQHSVQALTFHSETPFTSHPMFGHDIIYTHIANRGSAVGRTAESDFLAFAQSVSKLEGGVYLSIGSAVMSPMIFEKSLSMARNVSHQENLTIQDCSIHVVDLQKESWDWSNGEPPADNPAYYLRFMKTFNRMGCRINYTTADNRLYLIGLFQELNKRENQQN
jgi:hypothetical protein